MTSFKFVLRKSKKRTDDTIPIYLRITHNRKTSFIATGLSVIEPQWNANKGNVRKSHPSANVYNRRLEQILREAQNLATTLRSKGTLNAENIKKNLKGIDHTDFFAYAWQIADDVNARGQYWHWKNLRATLNKFSDFTKQRTVSFSDITPEMLRRFETYLRQPKSETGKGNNNTTINKRMKMLKRIFTIATNEDIIKYEDNPFRNYKLPSAKSYKDNKLLPDEISRLEKVKLPSESPLWHARNIFLFAFYCSGIRFGDVCQLKWDNVQNGRLIYSMSKTKQTKDQKLIPAAIEILKKYKPEKPGNFIFPLLSNEKDYSDESYLRQQISSKNAQLNSRLKKVAELAKIKPISFHASRHSFADFARTQNLSLFSISKALGHTDLKTTQIYLRQLDTEVTDRELDELWNKKSEK